MSDPNESDLHCDDMDDDEMLLIDRDDVPEVMTADDLVDHAKALVILANQPPRGRQLTYQEVRQDLRMEREIGHRRGRWDARQKMPIDEMAADMAAERNAMIDALGARFQEEQGRRKALPIFAAVERPDCVRTIRDGDCE